MELTNETRPRDGRRARPLAAPLAAATAAALLALLGARSASAELPPLPGSVQGGEVEIGGRGALTLGLGWPSTYARYDLPSRGSFGIGFRGDFFYGMPIFGFTFGLGTGFSVPMRIQLFDRDRWSVALFLRPQAFLGFGDRWWGFHPRDCLGWWSDALFLDFGMDVGVRVGLEATSFLDVFFGASTPLHVLVILPEGAEAEVDVFVNIVLLGGVEVALTETINAFAMVQVGPALGSYARCAACDDDRCIAWDRGFHPAFVGQFHAGFTFFF